MIPSRGLARVRPGLAFQSQILSRAPVRSIPRQAISRPSLLSPRQFGTSIRRSSNSIPTVGLFSGARIGAASVLSTQSNNIFSNRRFASTDSTTPTPATGHPNPSPELSPNTDFSSFTDFDAPSILNIPEGVGWLANLGLDYGHGPTSVCQWVVEHLHFTMGLGWFGAILGASVVIRVVMAYPALIAQYESHKSQELRKNPVYADLSKQQLISTVGGVDPHRLTQIRMQMSYMEKQHGLKKSRMFLPMLQIPFAYGMYKLTRGMAALPVPGLESGGALWFTDLTVADPLYILPCVSAVTFYLSMQRALPFMAEEQASMLKIVPFVLCPLTVILTLKFPAAVQLYFASAATLQYFQTTLWHMSFVRKLCGLPPLEDSIVNPKYIKKPADPFANRHATYQAPRTVNTTATEHKAGEEEEEEKKKGGLSNPLSMFRDVRKGLESWGKSQEDADRKAAREYEVRRIREENEKYRARQAEARRRQKEKKAEKK